MTDEQIATLDFSGWPIPDAYLVEIGRITALWSVLESLLGICIGKLAGFERQDDPRPFILVAHASFPQRLDMLGTLCEQLQTQHPRLKAAPATIAKLRAAQQARNRFAHNSPGLNEETGEIEIAIGSARGKLKTQVTRLEIVDLRRSVVEIHLATLALYELVLGRQLAPAWEQHGRQ